MVGDGCGCVCNAMPLMCNMMRCDLTRLPLSLPCAAAAAAEEEVEAVRATLAEMSDWVEDDDGTLEPGVYKNKAKAVQRAVDGLFKPKKKAEL